jgi:hypothetical protein
MSNVNKPQYREIRRKAAVGERIRIVNPVLSCGHYGKGDEATVTRVRDSGGVFFAGRTGEQLYALLSEYVVLEPVSTSPDLAESFAQFIRDHADTIRAMLDANEPEIEPAPTPQLTRAAVIEQARADVAELVRIGRSLSLDLPKDSPLHDRFYQIEFHVNREKRAVTALAKRGQTIVSRGIAKCAPGDVFNAEIGKAIAARKALGLALPDEYVNAPLPDEPRVGAVVNFHGLHREYNDRHTLSKRVESLDGSYFGNYAFRTNGSSIGWMADKQYEIIDDTDVDYNAVEAEGAAA